LARELDRVLVRYQGDFSSLKSGVSQITKSTTTLATGAKLAVGAFATRFAVNQLRNLVGSVGTAIEAARTQEISESKLAQALANMGETSGEAAAELKELAKQTQRVSNFGDESILTAQSMLLSFREVGGSQGAKLLTQSLVDMAAGLSKTSGETVDLNSVAQVLVKSLTQGVGALGRYGISLTDSQKKQFQMAKGMDRIKLLQEIVNDNFGGLAEATIDSSKQMQNSLGDLAEVFGAKLKPGIDEMNVAIMEFAESEEGIKAAEALGTAIAIVGNAVVATAEGFIKVSSAIGNFAGNVVTSFKGLFDSSKPLPPAYQAIADKAIAASEANSKLADTAVDVKTQVGNGTPIIDAQAIALKKFREEIIKTSEKWLALQRMQGGAGLKVDTEGLILDEVTKSAERATAAREAFRRNIERTAAVGVEFNKQQKETEDRLNAIADTRLATTLGILNAGMENLAMSGTAFLDPWSEGFGDVEKFFDGLSDSLKRVLQDFTKAIVKGLIFTAILSVVSPGAVGRLKDSLGSLGTILRLGGGGFTGGSVPQLAGGGTIMQTGLAVVHKDERILTPKQQIASAGMQQRQPPIQVTITPRVTGNDLLFVVEETARRNGRTLVR
jgi:hypothetical protein